MVVGNYGSLELWFLNLLLLGFMVLWDYDSLGFIVLRIYDSLECWFLEIMVFGIMTLWDYGS